jgi:hypothetical protein
VVDFFRRATKTCAVTKKEAKNFYSWRLRQDAGHGLQLGSGGRTKVFWFFSTEKNKTLLFLKKMKQKDFCLLGMV